MAGLEKTKELIRSTDKTVKTLELVVDVSDKSAVESMVNRTIAAFGELDYGECHLPYSTIQVSLTSTPAVNIAGVRLPSQVAIISLQLCVGNLF